MVEKCIVCLVFLLLLKPIIGTEEEIIGLLLSDKTTSHLYLKTSLGYHQSFGRVILMEFLLLRVLQNGLG